MPDYRFTRLVEWPGPYTKNRKPSTFRSTYPATLDLLSRELAALSARDVRIHMDTAPGNIRNDGLPRSDMRVSSPAIMLTFDSRVGSLCFPCDTYDDWKSNLRAIALTLERLRDIRRYGATREGQQYTGYQLPAPRPEITTGEEAARFLAKYSGVPWDDILAMQSARQKAYRLAAAKLHPDAGGANSDFILLQQAREILRTEE